MALGEKLMRQGTVKKFDRDEFIFSEGDKGSEMFIVLSGEVDIYVRSSDSSLLKVSTLKPGNFFGEMSLLEDLPRSASAVAATDLVLIAIDKNNLLDFIKEQPDMTFKILKGLSSRIRNLNEEISKLKSGVSPLEIRSRDTAAGADAGTAAAPSAQGGLLWPQGHKKYDMTEPESFAQYIYEKEMSCPVCGAAFKTEMQRVTKLKLDRVEKDFRKIYSEFDPLWYSILICPYCSFANFFTEFNTLTDKQYKLAKAAADKLRSYVSCKYTKPRNVNQVFTAYYLALRFAEACGFDALKQARLWMQLSWLYRDVQHEEMVEMASENAYRLYNDALFKSVSDMSTEQEQTIYIILAELQFRKGNKDEALKLFYKAVNKKVGKPVLNKMAEDRLYELKHG